MIPKKIRKFVEDLRRAADNGDINWEEGAPDAYFCNHKDTTLHLAYRFNQETGHASFNFRIVNAGKASIFFAEEEEEEDFKALSDLYSSVMANANDVDEVIDNFFAP